MVAATALALAASTAHAGPCQRPTDPGGFNGYDYGTDPVSSFDGTNVRIWYTTTGPHAVAPTTTPPNAAPDNVVKAATVGDAALATYLQMGFLPPVSDNGSAGSCGGDGRLDIYLMHFNAADGDTVTEACQTVGKAQQCSSFGLVEARLESIYGSFELGAHVVIAHELFHSVQDAYDANLDRFWAEGTAQWAAKTAYPAEMDLESFLPAFFQKAGQSIDISGGGVVADYLYGSAVWPVFLTEHVGPTAVRGAFEQEGKLGAPSMQAIDAALGGLGTSLADAYPTFVAWNAATGSRAGTGGYAEAKSYPQVTLTPFPSSGSVSDIATGYSAFFYSYDFGSDTQVLTLSGDATRLAARTFPLAGGKASLDRLSSLPATVTGAGVVVVAGISSKKSDAPFTLTAAPPSTMNDGGAPGGEPSPGPTKSGGCSLHAGSGTRDGAAAAALALLGAVLRRARRQRRRDS